MTNIQGCMRSNDNMLLHSSSSTYYKLNSISSIVVIQIHTKELVKYLAILHIHMTAYFSFSYMANGWNQALIWEVKSSDGNSHSRMVCVGDVKFKFIGLLMVTHSENGIGQIN